MSVWITRKPRQALGLFTITVSLVILVWGLWPQRRAARSIAVPSDKLQPKVFSTGNRPLPQPAGTNSKGPDPDAGRLDSGWPAVLRAGDSGTVHLVLQSNAMDLQPPVRDAGKGTPAANTLDPGSVAAYHIVAEARLDMAGIKINPEDLIREPLSMGQAVIFDWSIHPQKPGVYKGTLWLHLRFVPLNGGAESRVVLSAQQIEVRATSLLGLGGSPARFLGAAGLLLGFLLNLEDLVTWIRPLRFS